MLTGLNFYIKVNAYICDIIRYIILGFIGGISLSLSFLLHRIFLGSPYFTLFVRLFFISDG